MAVQRDIVHRPHDLVLKLATEELIAALGGTSSQPAREITYQQRLSDCQGRNTDAFLRIDEVGRAEDLTVGQPGWPHVTSALCRRQGGVFLRLPDAGAPPSQWSGFVAQLGKEAGELINGICTDLSNDNDVTPEEARKRLADAADLVRVAVNLEAALKARAEQD
jgi:hypothetical protein